MNTSTGPVMPFGVAQAITVPPSVVEETLRNPNSSMTTYLGVLVDNH